jgi:serine/threonine-protein kinase HipA
MLAIAKFPKLDDDRSIPHGEVLAMTLADKAGLNVSRARLQDVAGRSVLKRPTCCRQLASTSPTAVR